MKYLLKYSPEITIKSRPVRVRFVKQLIKNLRSLLRKVDERVTVISSRDYLEVISPYEVDDLRPQIEDILLGTPESHLLP